MVEAPKVSVAVITFNQEETIAQALDSVLCQRGNFSLDVVIGDDCSTDRTGEICKQYARRFLDKVSVLSSNCNQGIMANFARVVNACKGEYLAILAGDDYWCDDLKLQKQLNYLHQHPDCGVVCTDGYRLLVESGKMVSGLPPKSPSPDGDVRLYYYDRYGGVYAMPLTLLIRSDLLRFIDFDEYVRRRFPVEDYPMQSVLAHHTRFGYLSDKTVVYRVHNNSATFISVDHPRYMDYHRGLVEIRRYLHGLYPEDVPFSHEWADAYLFYKEFLLLLYCRDYDKARALVERAPFSIRSTRQYLNAQFAVRSRLHFTLFRIYKHL